MRRRLPGIGGQIQDALYTGISRRQASAEDRPPARQAADLVKAAGSQVAAAALIGVGPQTLRRWLKGTQAPTGANVGKLLAAGRAARLAPGREANLRAQKRVPAGKDRQGRTKYSNNRMALTGTVRVSGDVRTRTLNVGEYIPADVIGELLDRWKAGDDQGAAELLLGAVHEFYLADAVLESVDSIEFV